MNDFTKEELKKLVSIYEEAEVAHMNKIYEGICEFKLVREGNFPSSILNDFTKDELEDMSLLLSEYVEVPKDNPLYAKLDAMIKAFEHKHIYKETKESFLVTDYRCDICGEKLND